MDVQRLSFKHCRPQASAWPIVDRIFGRPLFAELHDWLAIFLRWAGSTQLLEAPTQEIETEVAGPSRSQKPRAEASAAKTTDSSRTGRDANGGQRIVNVELEGLDGKALLFIHIYEIHKCIDV
eukprot:scaffold102780_cov23-Prasinocladus_malaysianus.AAC.1